MHHLFCLHFIFIFCGNCSLCFMIRIWEPLISNSMSNLYIYQLSHKNLKTSTNCDIMIWKLFYHVQKRMGTMYIWIFADIMIYQIIRSIQVVFMSCQYKLCPYYCLSFFKRVYWRVRCHNRTQVWSWAR